MPNSHPARFVSGAAALAIFFGSFALGQRFLKPARVGPASIPTAAPQSTSQKEDNSPAVSQQVRADSPVAQQSVRQPLRDALAGDDPFVSAARVQAWLKTTTAETFRKLAEEPEKFPTIGYGGFNPELRTAVHDAIAARWLEFDPEGALPAMLRVEEALHKLTQGSELLASIAKRHPEMVLEKLPLKSGRHLAKHTLAALGRLATSDLKAAQKVAEGIKEEHLRKAAHRAIARGLVEKDPLGAVAMGAELNYDWLHRDALRAAEEISPGMVRQVLQAVGGKLGPHDLSPDFVLRNPGLASELPQVPASGDGPYVTEEMRDAADRLSPEEREQLLGSYDSLPANVRDGVAAAAALAWARTEPQKAAEWAIAHGKSHDGTSPASHAAHQVFLRWINSDPDTALTWWRKLPPSALRDAIGTNASTFLAEEGRLTEALEMFRPRPEDSAPASAGGGKQPVRTLTIMSGGRSPDEDAAAQLAQFLAERDPAAAGAWFAKLPANAGSQHAARVVVGEWYVRDPEAVARWIETLPAGTPRDEATRVFVSNAAEQSPSGAAEWAETVQDPGLRQFAASFVFHKWRKEDPARAQQWISSLRDVDPEWKARLLRRSR